MATTRLIRTPSSASNRKTFTISLWFKIGRHPYTDGGSGTAREIIGQTSSGYFRCIINSAGAIVCYNEAPGFNFTTNRKFNDKSAFYHIVIRVDTTQATVNDRVRIYINGVDERTVGGYSASGYVTPSQNEDLDWNITSVHQIGGHDNNYDYFSGVMSHIHHCDGQSYAPTVFGSVDATTGEWKINTSPTITMGTNGFTILKDGNTITDQSSNSNDFTLASGTLTNTEDCPSNVFATLNAIDNYYASATYSNGNLSITTDTSKYAPSYSTLGASSGKYYAEVKMTSGSSARIGIISRLPQDTGATSSPGNNAYSVGYYSVHGAYYISSSSNSYGNSYTNGDIIGIAMDLDNNRLFFSKNGTWQNSGDPTSSTGAITIPTSYSGFYHFAVGDQHDSQNAGFTFNFGNGYFGTTAVSSAGTNASGIGIFEYDVPTGYTALSTKGLNS
jgi:hypothetical protein